MDELRPCPFCGGEATLELIEVDEPFTFSDLYYTVYCRHCCFEIGHFRIPKLPEFCEEENKVAKRKAIEAWNRRQPQRMRGRWEISSLTRGPMRYCYECGFGQYVEDERVYSFCPNCGARMDGGEQE